MARQTLGGRSILQFVILILVALVCLYFIFMMMIHSHPRESPEVKTGGHSQLRLSMLPSTYC